MSPHNKIVAFLDIGTNSIRLMVVRFDSNYSHTILNQQKEVVRLGKNEFAKQVLQPAAIQRAAVVCGRFADMARSYGADKIIAVATSATREAFNQDMFLRQLQKKAGIDAHVISGREEARLIYLGVASAVDLGRKQAIFMDIGGGSTEIAVGTQAAYQHLDSIKLGAIRIYDRFFHDGYDKAVSDRVYRKIKDYARNTAVRAIERISRYRIDAAYGSSGTIMNLGDIAVRESLGRRLQRGDKLTLRQLQNVARRLRNLSLPERKEVPGLNPDRADVIIGGAAILEVLMEELALDEVIISDRSLRDGLVLDFIARRGKRHLPQPLSVREKSVLHLGRICGFDEAHALKVAGFAGKLFDLTKRLNLHRLGAWEKELVYYAALLHDIGIFLSYGNHHAHSYYLIRNADLIGFDRNEIEIIAAAAYFHRKNLPRGKHPEFSSLSDRAQSTVRILCVILRLAESLDRSHSGRVTGVSMRSLDAKHVLLTFKSNQKCQLELWGAENQAKSFNAIFDKILLVRSKEGGAHAKK
jgi:exopolyphosphatase / guanosine-5'-triphosphate,3'-diphosphate pyrophosphatase